MLVATSRNGATLLKTVCHWLSAVVRAPPGCNGCPARVEKDFNWKRIGTFACVSDATPRNNGVIVVPPGRFQKFVATRVFFFFVLFFGTIGKEKDGEIGVRRS